MDACMGDIGAPAPTAITVNLAAVILLAYLQTARLFAFLTIVPTVPLI
jgi:hypothetical protein